MQEQTYQNSARKVLFALILVFFYIFLLYLSQYLLFTIRDGSDFWLEVDYLAHFRLFFHHFPIFILNFASLYLHSFFDRYIAPTGSKGLHDIRETIRDIYDTHMRMLRELVFQRLCSSLTA